VIATTCIAAEHGSVSRIFQLAPQQLVAWCSGSVICHMKLLYTLSPVSTEMVRAISVCNQAN